MHTIFLLSLAAAALADNEIAVQHAFKAAYPDWKPRGIVDVGANRGGWTINMQNLYPNVTTFMIEASPFHQDQLNSVKSQYPETVVDYKIALLSKADGESVQFYDNPGTNTGNSMFQENSIHFANVEPQTRTTSKLDTLVSHMEHVDILKLDVQGAELMVLSGASETLKRATLVQFEASFIEYNKGGACLHQIDELLRHHGFYPYDIGDLSRHEVAFHTKAIGQLDVLYIRPGSDYMPKWLVDNKVQFCGSDRTAEMKNEIDADKSTTSKAEVTVAGSADNGPHKIELLMVGIVTFAVGYFTGRKKGKSSTKAL